MADETGKAENAIWPMPKFYFKVLWGDTTLRFSEVSGLDTETQIVEYRHGDGKEFAIQKMPGIGGLGNVTMKSGVFLSGGPYLDWYSRIQLNTINKRQTIIIQLLDEEGRPIMTWTLHNAWPTKITSTDPESDGEETAIDTLEVAFERLEVAGMS